MNKDLNGKIAIVTGAASGIGRASAIMLGKAGAKVGLIDLDKEKALKVEQEIKSSGGEAVVLEANISNNKEVEKSINEIATKWGEIDFLFANAGTNGRVAPIEDLTSEDWSDTVDNNLKGTFLTVKHTIPYMKEKGGSIVITSSVNGNRTFSGFGMSAYSASKAGQMAFGKMAALELAEYNIRVNIICPGAIETNINGIEEEDKKRLEKVEIPIEYPEGDQPLENRPGTPEQVADLIHFLASDQSRHISGTELFIDGAESLLR